MSEKEKRDYLDKLDQFLGMFDIEELITDGINYVVFNYQKKSGKNISKSFTVNEIKKIKEKKNYV